MYGHVNEGIADVLGVKICVSKEKKAILNCLECPGLSESLTTDYTKSCLHILPMAKLNLRVSEQPSYIHHNNSIAYSSQGEHVNLNSLSPLVCTYRTLVSTMTSGAQVTPDYLPLNLLDGPILVAWLIFLPLHRE